MSVCLDRYLQVSGDVSTGKNANACRKVYGEYREEALHHSSYFDVRVVPVLLEKFLCEQLARYCTLRCFLVALPITSIA